MSKGGMPADRPLPVDRRLPLVDRLPPSAPGYERILAAHEAALAQDEDGYDDPATGWFVFTAAAHWERGVCCGSGCRHCPYEDGPRGPGRVVPAPLPREN